MRYIIYKVTNKINNRYYIGRHSTTNINDGYLGSGIAIKTAIIKYGCENFTKEILAEATSAQELWDLEAKIVSKDIVDDPLSYNMVSGGKSYLNSLKNSDPKKFFEHQSNAGKKGGKISISKKNHEWHAKGGSASRKVINARIKYRLVTNMNEELFLDANTFKQTCYERGWNYCTLSWSVTTGKRAPIKRGPLKGFFIERLT